MNSTAAAPSDMLAEVSASRMTPAEKSATGWLASIFALRMLGLFMILPVFALHARYMPGGDNATLIGIAMGIYGLTQAVLQIPFGWASDRVGRKPIIIAGLILFAVGSFYAAMAQDVLHLTIGRAVQGAGAISAAVTAFLADLTRDEHRSKAMAVVGGSIGLTFALSLVAAPALYQWVGLSGLFSMTGVLATAAIAVVLYRLPGPFWAGRHKTVSLDKPHWTAVVFMPDLLRLNAGIFILHMTQMALFVVMPSVILDVGQLPVAQHWQVYLPVVLLSFAGMVPPMIHAERKAKNKQVKLAAIFLMAFVQAGFAVVGTHWWAVVALLVLYFVAFNLLEAMLPSWVSRVAPAASKGLALGVYNTTQALGLFAGGALGGVLLKGFGASAVFECIAAFTVLWGVISFGLRPLAKRSAPTA